MVIPLFYDLHLQDMNTYFFHDYRQEVLVHGEGKVFTFSQLKVLRKCIDLQSIRYLTFFKKTHRRADSSFYNNKLLGPVVCRP